VRILATLLLTGCAHYPVPEEQTGILKFTIVDTQEEVAEICKNPLALACASPRILVLNRNDWEHYITHEMAHVLGVLHHD